MWGGFREGKQERDRSQDKDATGERVEIPDVTGPAKFIDGNERNTPSPSTSMNRRCAPESFFVRASRALVLCCRSNITFKLCSQLVVQSDLDFQGLLLSFVQHIFVCRAEEVRLREAAEKPNAPALAKAQ